MNKNRRNLFKFLLIGSGALLLGKIFGPDLLKFFSDSKTEKDFKGFRVIENKKELSIYDKTGEKIFVIDKEK